MKTLYENFLLILDNLRTQPFIDPFHNTEIEKEVVQIEIQDIDSQILKLKSKRQTLFKQLSSLTKHEFNHSILHLHPPNERINHIPTLGKVNAVDFTPTLTKIAFSTSNGVYIMDTCDYNPQLLSNDHVGGNLCLNFYGAETVVAADSGNNNSDIKFWKLNSENFSESQVLTDHLQPIKKLWFEDGLISSSSMDKTVRLWDLQTGRTTQVVDTVRFGVCDAIQHTKFALATGSQDGIVRLWDLRQPTNNNTNSRNLGDGRSPSILSLQFNGLELVTGDASGSLKIWDLRKGQVVQTESYPGAIQNLNFDSQRIVSFIAHEMGVRVIDRQTNEHTMRALDLPNPVTACKYEQGYLTLGRNSSIDLWAI